jgi:hypothetical protein
MAIKIPETLITETQWVDFFEELRNESDRGTAILYAAWIDHLLDLKLSKHFGSAWTSKRTKSRANLASRIRNCFELGWLDEDVRDDIDQIRRIRNDFAHKPHGISLKSVGVRERVALLRVPHREFYDWDEVAAASIKGGTGFVLFAGEKPDDAEEALDLTSFKFRFAASWILAHLVANLNIGISYEGKDNTAGSSKGVRWFAA